MKKYLIFLLAILLPSSLWAACTATEQSADYSPVGTTTATLSTGVLGDGQTHTMNVAANGDLVGIAAWCYQTCTPSAPTMGSQTAIADATHTPGTTIGIDGLHTGQGYIYYITNATAGSHTLSWTVVGSSQVQLSYIDFKPSTGCIFAHNANSSVGSATGGGTANSPSLSGVSGNVLFGITVTTQHVNSPVNSPWSCPVYSGSGETQTCNIDVTQNGQAYILSAGAGTISNNWTLINSSTGYEAILTSFSMSQLTANSCPTGFPTSGNNCYYISNSGSDGNSGAYESAPWLHAPGMPNCASSCGSLSAGTGDKGFIFRGGDTWNAGQNTGDYTGGTWTIYDWFTNSYANPVSNCTWGVYSGCIYFGVDQTWYSGSSWARPIVTGDNATNTSLTASCAHQVTNSSTYGGDNDLVIVAAGTVLDSFELTGMCSSDGSVTSGNQDTYVVYPGASTGLGGAPQTLINVYIHGWTATTTAGHTSNTQPGTLVGGGSNGVQQFDKMVIDGQDSNPGSWAWGTFPSFLHFRDSIVRYTNQGVGQDCHDIHDNIFEHLYNHNTGAGSHTNALECNDDANGSTPNVFYNNILRHDDPSYVGSGQVHFWFCPETPAEYWFNNLVYDVSPEGGNGWAYAGPATYGCPNTGGQFMFNNTFVDFEIPCNVSTNTNGGKYITVLNNHLINTPFYNSTGGTNSCIGYNDSSNIVQTNSQATSQGYTTGSSGTVGNGNTCANESTTPCVPVSGSVATVNSGGNHQAYCTALAVFSGESAIGTDAANACKNSTTDGCAYITATHSMSCPAQVAVIRPTSGAWDTGSYQFSGSISTPPPAPASNMFVGTPVIFNGKVTIQ